MKNGFIDIHTHGAINIDVNSATTDELLKLSDFFKEHGCDAWLPTIRTDSEENMLEACSRVARAMCNQKSGARILGIHLEGPFLSPLFGGAMNRTYLRKGDCRFIERLIKASEGCMDVIREFSKDIAISLGHSNATYKEAMKAFELGANCITHCGNAMRLFHQHEPGLLGAAFDSDCYIEVIGDGLHIAPDSVKVYLKIKGPERILIVTDSMSATGIGDGEFMIGGSRVVVKNGDARIPELDVRAGSILPMDRAFENICRFTGLGEDDVYPMFRENQERLLGINLD